MRASYTGKDPGLRSAAAYVNELNGNASFWAEIGKKPDFTYSTLSSREIQRRLQTSDLTVKIKLWKAPAGREDDYKNTVAITFSNIPNTLFYHNIKLGRKVHQKVNTIVHEYVHNVDRFDDGNSGRQMGHGSNSSVGKGDSAPYWIGGLAQRYYRRVRGLFGPLLFEEPYEHVEESDFVGEVIEEDERPLRAYSDESADVSLRSEAGSGDLALPALLIGAGLALGAYLVAKRKR